MSDTNLRQIVLAARPQGEVRLSDFRPEEMAMPTPGPGEMLLKVRYLYPRPVYARLYGPQKVVRRANRALAP
jgi:NADPH-dependent curcumin reductase CurA